MDILDSPHTPHPEVMVSRVGDEIVILHPVNATYYGLDRTGTKVWELLQLGSLPRSICEQVAREHDAEIERVENDVSTFLINLLEHGLIEAR